MRLNLENELTSEAENYGSVSANFGVSIFSRGSSDLILQNILHLHSNNVV